MTRPPARAATVPRRTCRFLVALAVCMLPAAQRVRYAEEFSDELLELPHGEQRGHALRLLGRSLSLRHVLNDSLRDSSIPRPRRNPVFVPFAAAAAVLMVSFSGVGVGARAAEPGDPLWTLTKVLYTDYAGSEEAKAEARDQLAQAFVALEEGRVDDTQSALARAQDALSAMDEGSRVELEKEAAAVSNELG